MYQSWSNGYFTGLPYIDSYVAEINPLLLQLNLTLSGIKFGHTHKIAPLDNLHYLELGFGRGSSLNIHAAACEGYFVGTDFNPNHALNAQNFAQASNAYIKIFDYNFKELLEYLKSKAQVFDIIVLHGVWSWVSIENQNRILKIIKNYLKLGGIVYVSYNCFPGWLQTHAARNLLMQFYQQTNGHATHKIMQAIMLFEDFLNQNTSFDTPTHREFLDEIKQKNPAYIAHEYLNTDWNSCYFSEMVAKMQAIKCDFACSSSILDHFDVDAQLHEDTIMRHQLQDYNINRRFRADIFIHGKQELHFQESMQKILNTPFALIKLPKYFKYNSQAKNNIFENLIQQILNFLAKDSYRPKTGKEIFEDCNLPFREFLTSLSVIIHQGIAMPTQQPSTTIKAKTKQYNHHLFAQQALAHSSIFAASPITGGGIVVSEVEQLFILAQLNGLRSFQEIREYVWNILRLQNRGLAQGNYQAQSEQENLTLLKESLKEFMEEKMLLFQALEIY